MISRRPIRSVSAKRKAEQPEYERAVKRVFARDKGLCQAARLWPEIACAGRIDPHHRWPVGEGGPRCDPDNILLLCRRHHDAAHVEDRAKATRLGLISRGPQ